MTTNRAIRLTFGRASMAASPVLAAALLFATAGVASADCAMPLPVEKAVVVADIVFVGTVRSTSNGNRWAEVAVQEVWRGPDVPATVVVQGGPAGNTMTSVDRSFQVGATYLFFPYLDPDTGALADNSCTSTTDWTVDMEQLRPPDARPPTAAPAATTGGFDVESLLPLGVAILVFGGLLVAGLLARGRQES